VLVVLSGVQEVGEAIATEEGARDAAGWTGLVSPFTLVDGVSRRLLGVDELDGIGPPGTVGTLVFCAVTALLVAVCAAILVLRYRRVSIS